MFKKTIITGLIIFASSQSLAVQKPQLKTEHVRTERTDNKQSMTFKVDNIDIELEQDDLIRSHYWGLEPKEWARYKFIMKYTPRGMWTPDLDPPIVLGNLAKTDEERLRYAKIMNEMEVERRKGELKFELVGQAHAKQYKPPKNERTGPITQHLPEMKNRLKSVFVDLKDCDKECVNFVRTQINSHSRRDKIDLWIAGGQSYSQRELYKLLMVNKAKIARGDLSIGNSEAQVRKQASKHGLPVSILRTDDGADIIKP